MREYLVRISHVNIWIESCADAYMGGSWLIHMCDSWLIHLCDSWPIHVCDPWLIHMCDPWLIHVCDSWLIHMCDSWLIYFCDRFVFSTKVALRQSDLCPWHPKRYVCHVATYCNTLHDTATRCNTLQHTATHRSVSMASKEVRMSRCNTLHHTATHCNTLQHTATHYITLQHTTSHCNTLYVCLDARTSVLCLRQVQVLVRHMYLCRKFLGYFGKRALQK